VLERAPDRVRVIVGVRARDHHTTWRRDARGLDERARWIVEVVQNE
jgi:hypothetical protein